MANPLRRPFMTSLGVGAIVFVCLTAASGYIDVLKITPGQMSFIALLATLTCWAITFLLLRRYDKKRGDHVTT